MKRFVLSAVLVAGLAAVAACSASGAPAAAPKVAVAAKPAAQAQAAAQPAVVAGGMQTFEILEMANQFQPSRVTVKAGSKVRFLLRNDDAEEHNIVSGQIQFPQNQQHSGGTFTVDWTAPQQPGTYDAICAFHAPGMVMKIDVQ